MKIAIDARPALWDPTGIGKSVYNIIRNIRTQDPSNEYLFFFDQSPGRLGDELGLQNCYYSCIKNNDLWTNIYFYNVLRSNKYNYFLTFLERGFPILTRGTKGIVMICDLIPLTYPEDYFYSNIHKFLYRKYMQYVISKSTKILTISRYSKENLCQVFNIDNNKVSVISLGYSPNAEKYDLYQTPSKIMEKYIFALGSSEPRKNNSNLIRAFNMLSEGMPELRLVIGGRKWRGTHFPDDILNNRIILTGALSESELHDMYKNSAAFCLLSLYEGFGLPALEAMGHGVPLILANTSSLPEIAGDAAIYVDPNNIHDISIAILNVLTNENLRNELISKGRSRTRKFTWENTCRQIAFNINTTTSSCTSA